MRSMTGYGRGQALAHGVKYSVELNSVNRKQADIVINLPRELVELEPRIRDEINAVIVRGRLNVVVAWHRARSKTANLFELDYTLASNYLKAIGKLRTSLNLKESASLETLLRCPGVLKMLEADIDPDQAWPHIDRALKGALSQLIKMREKEGRFLSQDLLERVAVMGELVLRIKKLVPSMVERYRVQLHERIKKSGIDLSFEDDRLVKEVIFFADRSDVTEELTRLESHLKQMRESLHSKEAIGRTLEFLSQEINREVNTISNKANHLEISQHVISIKTELERVREQIQNVE
jgi:uncharacterized protein (TIGR00255 family)